MVNHVYGNTKIKILKNFKKLIEYSILFFLSFFYKFNKTQKIIISSAMYAPWKDDEKFFLKSKTKMSWIQNRFGIDFRILVRPAGSFCVIEIYSNITNISGGPDPSYIVDPFYHQLSQLISEQPPIDVGVINIKTKEVLDMFKDAFKEEIKVVENEKNLGLPATLNAGIKVSEGKYIVRVDSDDYVNRNFLLILYMMVNLNHDYSAVACDYYLVNDDEKILEQVDCDKEPIGCGIIFERDHIKSVGLYNENYLINEEKEFRKRYEKKYSIKRLPLPLYRYRRHSENMTNQNEK